MSSGPCGPPNATTRHGIEGIEHAGVTCLAIILGFAHDHSRGGRHARRLAPHVSFRSTFSAALTMAAMVIVNNPGDWGTVYSPLLHAEWHGWTPTDLIFPFFLFIVGVSITLSRRRRRAGEASSGAAALIFALGLFLAGYPRFDLDPLAHSRRAAAHRRLLSVRRRRVSDSPQGDRKTQARSLFGIAIVLAVGYWLLMTFVPPPGGVAGDLSPEGNLRRLDRSRACWAVTSGSHDGIPRGCSAPCRPSRRRCSASSPACGWDRRNAAAQGDLSSRSPACAGIAVGLSLVHRVSDQQEPLDQFVRDLHRRRGIVAPRRVLLDRSTFGDGEAGRSRSSCSDRTPSRSSSPRGCSAERSGCIGWHGADGSDIPFNRYAT